MEVSSFYGNPTATIPENENAAADCSGPALQLPRRSSPAQAGQEAEGKGPGSQPVAIAPGSAPLPNRTWAGNGNTPQPELPCSG